MNGRGQAGSIPLVLVAAIILAGLVVALFTIVQSSQRSVGRDRDVNQSIQIADAGVQEAFIRLATAQEDETDDLYVEPGETIDLSPDDATSESGEGTYTWQAHRSSRGVWQVRSTGVYRTHTSVIEAEVGWRQQFFFALWGDSKAGISAGNANLGHLMGGIPVMGSNGPMIVPNTWIPPQSTIVPDSVEVQCHGPDNTDNCEDIPGADLIQESLDFPDIASAAYAPAGDAVDVDFAGACWDEEIGQEKTDGPFDPDGPPLERGKIYCFDQVVFDRGSEPVILEGSSDEPVRIFIRPTPEDAASTPALIVGGSGSNFATVNWEPADLSGDAFVADPSSLKSSASDLIINVAGNRLVSFENNASVIAAGIYAPRARCEIRAQVTIAGALICGEIPDTGPGSGSGGWNLVYDPGLEDESIDGVFSIRRWSQGFCGRSNFDWADASCDVPLGLP